MRFYLNIIALIGKEDERCIVQSLACFSDVFLGCLEAKQETLSGTKCLPEARLLSL
jgi:hypothetical protein